MTYEKAYAKLQDIMDKLRSEEVSIGQMKKHVMKAKELIAYCQDRLREIEDDLMDEEE